MGISVGAPSDLAPRRGFYRSSGGDSQAASRRCRRPPTPIMLAFVQMPTLAAGGGTWKQYIGESARDGF